MNVAYAMMPDQWTAFPRRLERLPHPGLKTGLIAGPRYAGFLADDMETAKFTDHSTQVRDQGFASSFGTYAFCLLHERNLPLLTVAERCRDWRRRPRPFPKTRKPLRSTPKGMERSYRPRRHIPRRLYSLSSIRYGDDSSRVDVQTSHAATSISCDPTVTSNHRS